MSNGTFEKQTTAIKNARDLLKEYNPHIPARDNPYTTVHLLVEKLNKYASPQNEPRKWVWTSTNNT